MRWFKYFLQASLTAAINVLKGITDRFTNTQTHTHTHTLSLSLSLSL